MDQTIQQLIKRFKTNNPFAIAEGLNILIRYADLDDGIRGFYYKTLRRRFIVINSGLSYEWQRIICAHELGHDRLHPGLNRFWIDEHTFFNAGKFERQANTFAIKLLTYDLNQNQDESLESYMLRCGIPRELHKLYL